MGEAAQGRNHSDEQAQSRARHDVRLRRQVETLPVLQKGKEMIALILVIAAALVAESSIPAAMILTACAVVVVLIHGRASRSV
jgi:hypothetical protein